MDMHYGLVILGGGSGAFAAATKANDLGVKTALIDEREIGGTCVNRGCVPSKLLLEIGNILHRCRHGEFEAVQGEASFDFKRAMKEKREVVERLRQSNYRKVIEGMESIDLYEGSGKFVGSNRVEVDGEVIEGEKFIVATGSRPNIVPFRGIEEVDVLTSEEALELEEVPGSLIVIGGRALALEFAQMYARFGAEVTVLQRSPRILPDHEPQVSQELTRCLTEEGIRILTGVEILELGQEKGKKRVRFMANLKEKEIQGDQILMATGRRPNTDGIGLEKAGVEVDGKGFVKINQHMQTTNPSIYAAGDCASPVMLETLAAKMGNVAASNILENAEKTINLREIPRAVFTDPQVASVGYTDEEYRKKTGVCACRTIPMELVPKAQVIKDTRGIIKMVVNPGTEQIVGVHIVSPLAAEMIHEATLVVKFKLRLDDITDTTHVFPTMSEAIKKVAHAFKRDVSSMSCCIE
jgi:mercuric reductase